MLKQLLLASCGALAAFQSHAQGADMQVKLPGEALPEAGSTALLAARATSTISQLQEILVQNWTNNTVWADYSRQVYLRYRTPTLPGAIRTDRKVGGSWNLYGVHRYRYTSAGEMQSDSIDQYQQQPYGPYFAHIFTFTTPRQVRWEWQKMKMTAVEWDSLKRNSYTYNAAGKHTEVLEQFYTGSNTFSTVARRLWTYNTLGQIAVYETQSANSGGGGGWSGLQRATYTYNAAGKVQQSITEGASLSTGAYLNSSRNTYTFDAQGREAVLTTERWTNNAWTRYSQTLYAYNSNGDLTTATLQGWNTSTNQYQNAQRILLTYTQVASARRSAGAASLLSIAPNPAGTAGAEVFYKLATPAATSVEVLDLSGRRVALVRPLASQPVGEHHVPLTGLAPGLYTVRLQAGEQLSHLKLVVQ